MNIACHTIIQPDVSADEKEDGGMEDNRGIPGWDKVHNLAKALVSLKNVILFCLTESFDYLNLHVLLFSYMTCT